MPLLSRALSLILCVALWLSASPVPVRAAFSSDTAFSHAETPAPASHERAFPFPKEATGNLRAVAAAPAVEHRHGRILADNPSHVPDSYDRTADSASSTNIYTGEQLVAARGLYYLRARLMNPLTGRFWSADSYEGTKRDPASLHKYLYCGNNPMNSTDPTGCFSLTEITTVGAIIGTVAGAVYGFRKGYEKTGKIFSFTTFAYTLGYAAVGATAGAQIGAFIGYLTVGGIGLGSGGVFATIIKVTPKLITQLTRIVAGRGLGAGGSVVTVSFVAGILTGVAAAIETPDEYRNSVALTSNGIYGGGHVFEIGYTGLNDLFSLGLPKTPGWTQATLAFITGFNIGYQATAILSGTELPVDQNMGDIR